MPRVERCPHPVVDGQSTGTPVPPVNTWLQDCVRLAAQSLSYRIDKQAGNRPFFWFSLQTNPPSLQHDYWDCCDMAGRWVDAWSLARLMLGKSYETEEQIKNYLLAQQRPDGLFYSDPGPTHSLINIGNIPNRPSADMFCQSRVLLGLTTWYLEETNGDIAQRIENLLFRLEALLQWNGTACCAAGLRWLGDAWQGRWGDEQDQLKENIVSGYAATMAPFMLRYHQASGSLRALKVARGLVHGFLLDREKYSAQGVYRGNTHWAGGLLAVAAGTRLARIDRDERLLAFCRQCFEHIISFSTDFGWMPEYINRPGLGDHANTCEVCNLTDGIHTAIQLMEAGVGDYWDWIDTTIRNRVLEQQFRDPTVLVSDQDAARTTQPIMQALHGSIESVAPVNSLVGNPKGIEGCCTSAGIRACYFAWQKAAEWRDGRVWVHLPFSRTSPWLDVLCHEPWAGAVTLRVHQACDVSWRVPLWVNRDDTLVTEYNGVRVPNQFAGRYLMLDQLRAGDQITISYPLRKRKRHYRILGAEYEASWLGGTVAAMTPVGKPYPIYQPQRLRNPVGPPALGRPQSHVVW